MSAKYTIRVVAFLCGVSLSPAACAWFIFFPIPNVRMPPALNNLIEALEKSDETKAVAYVSEDKTFGAKFWVWSHFAGRVTQAEADRIALSRCEASLSNAKSRQAGGQALYDFGTKTCELYSFVNKTVSLPPPVQQSAPLVPATPPSIPALPASTTAPVEQGPSSPRPTSVPALQSHSPDAKQHGLDSPTARKLRELDQLRKEGLITEQEYEEKRKAVLLAM